MKEGSGLNQPQTEVSETKYGNPEQLLWFGTITFFKSFPWQTKSNHRLLPASKAANFKYLKRNNIAYSHLGQ